MTVTIGSNISSLRAQRKLNEATDANARIYERLSSGLRITSAADDAAGLSVSLALNSSTRIYTQAIRNINDGISASAIMSGATDSLGNIIERLTELSTQAMTGTLSYAQRSSINKEAQALRDEFNRVVSTTKFNGISLLASNGGSIRLEAGDTSNQGALYLNAGSLNVGRVGSGTFTGPLSAGYVPFEAADFNNDGIVDLYGVASSGAPRVIISFGNGDGTFQGRTTVSLTVGAGVSIPIGADDFNGDGNLDLAYTSGGTQKMVIALGNGNGTFKAATTTAFSVSNEFWLKDLNQDGKADIITEDGIFQSLSNGQYATLNFSASIADAAFSDVNNDGTVDVLAINSSGKIDVYLNNGNGGFSSPRSYGYSSGAYLTIKTGDFNGDKIDDVIVWDGNVSTDIHVFMNNGNGTFRSPITSSIAAIAGGAYNGRGMQSADFNGDGTGDLLYTLFTDTTLLFLGNSNGTFRAPTSFADSGLTSFLSDFNNDGVKDIFLTGIGQYYLTNTTGVSELNSIDLSTRTGALYSHRLLLDARDRLITARGRLGADESRLGFASQVISKVRENYQAAYSQITDADIAADAAALTRTNILQQAATAILSHANLLPQIALSLIK